MKCHKSEGVLIPGCMGVAAASSGSALTDSQLIELYCTCEADDATDEPDSCFAFKENNGSLDIDSISETEEGVRFKMLEACMGWRFNHPDRYSQDEEWVRLLEFGKIVPVLVSLAESEAGDD